MLGTTYAKLFTIQAGAVGAIRFEMPENSYEVSEYGSVFSLTDNLGHISLDCEGQWVLDRMDNVKKAPSLNQVLSDALGSPHTVVNITASPYDPTRGRNVRPVQVTVVYPNHILGI